MVTRGADGTPRIHEPLGSGHTDLAILVLKQPVKGISPIPTAPLGQLDAVDLNQTSLLGIGYGLSFHKLRPATPDQPHGDGPTNFTGDFGVRRIANLGTIRSISRDQIVPTQSLLRGQNAVCYGDSGSPLFLVEGGQVKRSVVGVLTGAALWCMGSHDPYRRVDTETAIAFLDCVRSAQSVRAACECGIEGSLGLCNNVN